MSSPTPRQNGAGYRPIVSSPLNPTPDHQPRADARQPSQSRRSAARKKPVDVRKSPQSMPTPPATVIDVGTRSRRRPVPPPPPSSSTPAAAHHSPRRTVARTTTTTSRPLPPTPPPSPRAASPAAMTPQKLLQLSPTQRLLRQKAADAWRLETRLRALKAAGEADAANTDALGRKLQQQQACRLGTTTTAATTTTTAPRPLPPIPHLRRDESSTARLKTGHGIELRSLADDGGDLGLGLRVVDDDDDVFGGHDDGVKDDGNLRPRAAEAGQARDPFVVIIEDLCPVDGRHHRPSTSILPSDRCSPHNHGGPVGRLLPAAPIVPQQMATTRPGTTPRVAPSHTRLQLVAPRRREVDPLLPLHLVDAVEGTTRVDAVGGKYFVDAVGGAMATTMAGCRCRCGRVVAGGGGGVGLGGSGEVDYWCSSDARDRKNRLPRGTACRVFVALAMLCFFALLPVSRLPPVLLMGRDGGGE